MGEMIQFNRPDGKTCPGYLVAPKTGSSAWLCGHPGVVVQLAFFFYWRDSSLYPAATRSKAFKRIRVFANQQD